MEDIQTKKLRSMFAKATIDLLPDAMKCAKTGKQRESIKQIINVLKK